MQQRIANCHELYVFHGHLITTLVFCTLVLEGKENEKCLFEGKNKLKNKFSKTGRVLF